MTLTDLVNSLDQFDSTHNGDEIILITDGNTGRSSLGVLHRDGAPRPFTPILGSEFELTITHTGMNQEEDKMNQEEDKT